MRRPPLVSWHRRLPVATFLAATLLSGAAARPAAAQGSAVRPARPGASIAAQAPVVLVVRHAEKAATPGDDPGLSADGQARAVALRAALADAGVSAVLVTPRRRTAETAAPLAAARGLTPEVVPFGANGEAHALAVVAAVRRHAGGVVLVVGHSNTVPAIVAALGGPRMPDLCDAAYGNLFVLRPGAADAAASVVRAQYGRADGPEAASCAGMQVR